MEFSKKIKEEIEKSKKVQLYHKYDRWRLRLIHNKNPEYMEYFAKDYYIRDNVDIKDFKSILKDIRPDYQTTGF